MIHPEDLLSAVLGGLPGSGVPLLLVHLGLFVIVVIAMVKALTGVRWDIPFVGPIARKQMGEESV